MADNTPSRNPRTVIYYDEPPAKTPPLLEVGALAWIRKNLFGSPLDALLTIVGALLIIGAVVGLIDWIVTQADWFAIRFRLKQFTTGSMPYGEVWRFSLTILFFAFTIGATFAAYTRRLAPVIPLVVLLLALPTVVLPPLITALIPAPPIYFAAANQPIVAGSAAETPLERIGFLAQAGEQITIRFADFGATEDALADMNGFVDRATNTLRNAAANRRERLARVAAIQALLAADDATRAANKNAYGTLTANQRATLEDELGRIQFTPTDEATLQQIDAINKRLEDTRISAARRAELQAELQALTVPPLVTTTYQLNQFPVVLALLQADQTPLGEPRTLAPGDTVTFEIPATGWYLLEKTLPGTELSAAILQVNGILPVYYDAAERVYKRTQDAFAPSDPAPRVGATELPYVKLLENKYRGTRSLPDYLRMFVVPFLEVIRAAVILTLAAAAAGYVAARIINQSFVTTEPGTQPARRFSTWLLIASPIVMFALVNGTGIGFSFTDPDQWGGLLLALVITLYGMIFAFPIGVLLALGRRAKTLPIVSTMCTFLIEVVRGTPFIVVLFAGQLLIPLLSPALAEIPNVYRALLATIIFSAAYLAENVRGGLQSIPPGQEEAARALGLPGWQIVTFITLPQALRAVIPALVGQFISLFKDTSLLVIVGLLDLNFAVNAMVATPEFQNARREGLIFISLIYFVVSYAMAYVSRRLEESGSGAARRI